MRHPHLCHVDIKAFVHAASGVVCVCVCVWQEEVVSAEANQAATPVRTERSDQGG